MNEKIDILEFTVLLETAKKTFDKQSLADKGLLSFDPEEGWMLTEKAKKHLGIPSDV